MYNRHQKCFGRTTEQFIGGNLVMGHPFNRIVHILILKNLDSSGKDVYHLATENGHILNSLVKKKRLRQTQWT